MIMHLLGFSGYIIPLFGIVVGPLVGWLMKKDESPFIDRHGKASVNFEITILIAACISSVLAFVCIGVILLMIISIYQVVYIVINAINASNGKEPHYPLTIEFVK